MEHNVIKYGNHKINDDVNGYIYHLNTSDSSNFDSHIHQCYEFIHILKGKLLYTVEDKEYMITDGDLIITKPLEFHSFSFPEKCVYQREFLHIYPGMLKDYPELTKTLDHRTPEFLNRIPKVIVEKYGIDKIFRGLEEHCANPVPETHFMVFTYALQLACKISQILRCETLTKQEVITNPKTNSVCRYIDSHYKENLTIEKISKHIYMSPSHASRLFKKETGMTIKSYLTMRRITNAKSLIMQGNKTMNIYSDCGFSDYSSFYRAFTKYVGMTPNEFKRVQTNNE